MDEFITVQRFKYEEPGLTEIYLKASNGLFTGYVEYYCDVDELIAVGEKLKVYPVTSSDKMVYEIGSEDSNERWAYYFRFCVFMVDQKGHCVVGIRINRNGLPPNNGLADFSIKANPADLNSLGDLFLKLSKFEIGEFTWRPTSNRT